RRSALRCRPLSKDRPLRSYANIFTPSRAGAHSLPDHHHPLTPDRTEIYLKVRRVPDTHSSAVARGHHRARNGTPSTKTAKQREKPMATPDMKVHILDSGTMEADRTWLLLAPHTVIKTRAHKNDPRAWGQVPTHAVYIDHPEGKILWDTGVPRNWRQHWEPTGFDEFFPVLDDPEGDSGYLDSSLSQMGLAPDDIDILVLSHLHFDHAANAKMFDNGKTRIVTSQAELDGVAGITGYNKGATIPDDYKGLSIGGITGDDEIVPGVSVIQTPGHTWGTMSLRVDLPNEGTKIFTSDAVYMEESYGDPPIGAAIVWS